MADQKRGSRYLQDLVDRIQENARFRKSRRLGAGDTIAGLSDEELLRVIYGLARGQKLNLGNAHECLAPEGRNIWNAILSCSSRGIPGGSRTAISLPVDARLESPFYRLAQSYYNQLPDEQQRQVGDDRRAYVVDAAVDGLRLAAQNAWDSATRGDEGKLERMLAYMKNPARRAEFSDNLENYVITAWQEELQKRQSQPGGPARSPSRRESQPVGTSIRQSERGERKLSEAQLKDLDALVEADPKFFNKLSERVKGELLNYMQSRSRSAQLRRSAQRRR